MGQTHHTLPPYPHLRRHIHRPHKHTYWWSHSGTHPSGSSHRPHANSECYITPHTLEVTLDQREHDGPWQTGHNTHRERVWVGSALEYGTRRHLGLSKGRAAHSGGDQRAHTHNVHHQPWAAEGDDNGGGEAATAVMTGGAGGGGGVVVWWLHWLLSRSLPLPLTLNGQGQRACLPSCRIAPHFSAVLPSHFSFLALFFSCTPMPAVVLQGTTSGHLLMLLLLLVYPTQQLSRLTTTLARFPVSRCFTQQLIISHLQFTKRSRTAHAHTHTHTLACPTHTPLAFSKTVWKIKEKQLWQDSITKHICNKTLCISRITIKYPLHKIYD